MRLLMIVVDADHRQEVEAVLAASGVVGYTEISHATGVGSTGPRFASGAFPRSSAIVLTVLSRGALDAVAPKIRAACAECGERPRMFTWEVEEVA